MPWAGRTGTREPAYAAQTRAAAFVYAALTALITAGTFLPSGLNGAPPRPASELGGGRLAPEPSPSGAAISAAIGPANLALTTNLSGPWLMKHPDGSHAVVTLPGTFGKSRRHVTGRYSMRRQFTLDTKPQGLVALLGRIDDTDDVFVNGQRIGGFAGHWEPGDRRSPWFRERWYYIPRTAVRFGGARNEILIRSQNFVGLYGIHGDELALIPATAFFGAYVERLRQRLDYGELIQWLFLAYLAVQLIYYLMHFVLLRESYQEPALILFCLGSILVVFSYGQQKHFLLTDGLWVWKLPGLGFLLTVLGAGLFLRGYLNLRESWPLRIGLGALGGLFVAGLIFRRDLAEHLFLVSNALCALLLIWFVYLLLRVKRRSNEHYIVVTGILLAVAAGIHDVSDYFGGPSARISFGPYGLLSFMLSMTAMQSYRYVTTKRQLREANDAFSALTASLEEKVNERTRLLSEAKESIEQAHASMQQDRDLAAHAQQSFFASEPPQVPLWELRFVSLPATGVSGDFYDFYLERRSHARPGHQRHLLGVGLFDVSGHGTGAALFTMLARPIIARTFLHGGRSSLGDVTRQANVRLLNEISHIPYYLTGLLVRVNPKNPGSVEFVSAGHAAPFLRRADGSAPEAAAHEDRAGPPLAIQQFEADYEVSSLAMQPGDQLLLYTDGLTDAAGANDEPYGAARLLEAWQRVPGSEDLSVQMNAIIADLKGFLEGRPHKDDITAMLIRRTD